ncbi:MAG: hypothetical protein WCP28_06530 [Actinomycetes bacterium]
MNRTRITLGSAVVCVALVAPMSVALSPQASADPVAADPVAADPVAADPAPIGRTLASPVPVDLRGDQPAKSLAWRSSGPQPIAGMDNAPTFYSGRAPYSGRVSVLTPDPRNQDVAYLGSPNGGVWKTTNAGKSWLPISDSVPITPIGSIALDPGKPNTVYAGTGEYNRGKSSYEGAGILRSRNAGRTWSVLGRQVFDNCVVSDIVPRGRVLLVSAFSYDEDSARIMGRTNTCTGERSGIYRSTNGGRSFTRIKSNLLVQDLVVLPGGTVILASTFGQGIWRSPDSGRTWQQTSFPSSVTGRTEMTVDSKGVAFAVGSTRKGALAGVFRSTDSGFNWSPLPAPINDRFCNIPDEEGLPGETGQCDYDLAIAADPTRPGTFVAGGIYAYRWTANGSKYRLIGARQRPDGSPAAATIHVDIQALTYGGHRLWLGSDGGAYRSDNNGSSFKNLNSTLSITQFNTGLSGPPYAPLMGGTQDNGTLLMRANGTWVEPLDSDGGVTMTDPTKPRIRYGTQYYAALFRTKDSWRSGVPLAGPLVCPKSVPNGDLKCNFYSPFAMSLVDPKTIYAGTWELAMSNDRGTNWKSMGPAGLGTDYINAIGVTARSSALLAVGTNSGDIWATTDTGKNWSRAAGLPGRLISSIRYDFRAGRVYATTSGYGTAHLWRSDDNGVNWQPAEPRGKRGLPNYPANVVVIDTARGALYVGTDIGVYRSLNGGATWKLQRSGMPATPITDLLLDSRNRVLYAGTYGRGIYRSALP